MLVQAYHIKREKTGCVFITPICRGAKGRPYRNTNAMVKYPDLAKALSGIRVTVAFVKSYEQ